MTMTERQPATTLADEYDRAFFAESDIDYPEIDAFEKEIGFKLERYRLEQMARRLACPLKAHLPCWQHGRIIYAMVRQLIAGWDDSFIPADPLFLDIGTAKGFSALMMQTAIVDSGVPTPYFQVVSLDVIDPQARVRRNTVAEVDGLLTLEETLAPWREVAGWIDFRMADAALWLAKQDRRVHFVFIDGKHTYLAVRNELAQLARLQRSGDIVVADDAQIPGVMEALNEYRHAYVWRMLDAKPFRDHPNQTHAPRRYAVAMRR